MNIELSQHHFNMGTRRHTTMKHLWRSRCCCGQYFLAATEELAKMALDTHIESEEPFPSFEELKQ